MTDEEKLAAMDRVVALWDEWFRDEQTMSKYDRRPDIPLQDVVSKLGAALTGEKA